MDESIYSMNLESMQEYLKWGARVGSMSKKTLMDYHNRAKIFCRFLAENSVFILEASPNDIIAFHARLKSQIDAQGSGSVNGNMILQLVRHYYTWAAERKLLPSTIYPKKGVMEMFRRPPKERPFVLSYQAILNARKALNDFGRLEFAACFETYLSSGMRLAELCQLRVCDIHFGYRVRESETNRISPYVGAVVDLRNSDFILKNRTDRVIYIGTLASQLLKTHIAERKLKPNYPLFPWEPDTIRRWFYIFLYQILGKQSAAGMFMPTGAYDSHIVVDRKPDLSDIKSVGVEDEEFRKLLEKRAKKKISEEEEWRKSAMSECRNVRDAPDKKRLRVHHLRHTFCCLQYFRNYMGRRCDLLSIQKMMGHNSLHTLNIYLTKLQVVDSDRQWERIFLGNMLDYTKFTL